MNDPLVTVSAKRNRAYRRKFPHEEAVARFEAGERIPKLAREYGVTWAAVSRVVDPFVRARMDAQTKRWVASGVCENCGKEGIGRHNRRCRACFNDDQATSVRPDTLKCRRCDQWLPDTSFPRNRAETRRRRGRHSTCRTCGTAARRNYRERRKVPCPGCGQPTAPPNTEGRRRQDNPYCNHCTPTKGAEMPVEPTYIVLVQEKEGVWREQARVVARDRHNALSEAFNGTLPEHPVCVVSAQAFRPGKVVTVQAYDIEFA